MINDISFLNVKLKNRSVLASGILGVTLSSLKRLYQEGAGLVTTKSIGVEKRKGYNAPVIYDWGNGLINAVGLSNPGIDDFILQYNNEYVDFPVIVSIFGKTESDFPQIAKRLESLNFTFLELNISCPNVLDELGTPFSFSPELSYKITGSVKDETKTPVIVKLSPNTPHILEVAKSVEDGGADALCIMNTVGPGMVINTNTGIPVLGNRVGGISGDGVLPITVRNVYNVYREVSIPIIGTGGISSTDGALQVMMAGASMYGIGSAVYTKGISIFRDIENGVRDFLENNSFKSSEEIIGLVHRKKAVSFYVTQRGAGSEKRKDKTPEFKVMKVEDIKHERRSDIKTIFFDSEGISKPAPGQFYMLWIPGKNQKPFSVSYYGERTMGFSVIKRGLFSTELFKIKKGDPVGLLGPLGNGFSLGYKSYLLAGGGIGLAPLVYTAAELKRLGKEVNIIAGGKNIYSINWIFPLLDGLTGEKDNKIFYCTEDGSLGLRGMVTDHLQKIVDKTNPDFALLCGPEIFIKLSISIFKQNKIPGEASIERMMKCGIGICGSCTLDNTGDRVCIEGPVFPFVYIEKLEEFGVYKRDESGTIERF